MLQIRALKLDVNTTNGLYGATIPFEKGLNIVRANNTSGKSTLFQSITYALGFEELIGGRNEKTMQSVLKDIVVDKSQNYKVIQSEVLLEIFNGKEIVTIRRTVVNEKRKSNLVDVINGPFISNRYGKYSIRQMYLHDRGSATDEIYGFHAFLEEFLGWSLPKVIETSGNSTKLYLPLIAPAFIIEQKSGWSSFFGTMPFYNIRNAEERVLEFLMKLDVFQNEQFKIALNIDKKIVQEKWTILFKEFKRVADKGNADINGFDEFPTIINNIGDVYVRIFRNDKYYLIQELIQELESEFELISTQTEITVGDNLEKNQTRLQNLSDNLYRYSFRLEQLENESLHEREKLKQYIQQRKNVEDDLNQNKSAQKMLKLGGDIQSPIAYNTCPTCGQEINDSLLPAEVDQVPMQIDDNIEFLSSQHKMIDVYVNSLRKQLIEKDTFISEYRNRLTSIRNEIRNIKRDLVADERMPSEELIERKINTKRLISFYSDLLKDIESLKKQIQILSKEWENIKRAELELGKEFLSNLDREKLQYLEHTFLSLITNFNYQSKDKNSIKISTDKYLPVIEVKLPNEKPKSYDIRFDSSGSDHIRVMWAYYISLLINSNQFGGNHPKILIFDEPQQQSASTKDFHEFLKELASIKDTQTIVFASFQNSSQDFSQATKGLEFNKIETSDKFIVRSVENNDKATQ